MATVVRSATPTTAGPARTTTSMSMSSRALHSRWLDAIGVAVSVTCAVHCAASGFFFALLPWLGVAGAEQPWLEWGFLTAALGVGTWSLHGGWSHHGRRTPALVFLAGLALLLAARWMGEDAARWEPVLVVLGAAGVSTAHLLNARAVAVSRRCVPLAHTVR
jgi:hypothetical protein